MEPSTAFVLKSATTAISKALDDTSRRLKAIDAKLDLAMESKLMGSLDSFHQAIDEDDLEPIPELARDFQQLAFYYHGLFTDTVTEIRAHQGLLSQGVRRPIGRIKAFVLNDHSLTETTVSMAITSRGLGYLYRARSASLCVFMCNRIRGQRGAVVRAKQAEMFGRMRADDFHEPIRTRWGAWCVERDLPFFRLGAVQEHMVELIAHQTIRTHVSGFRPVESPFFTKAGRRVAESTQTKRRTAEVQAFHATYLPRLFDELYGNYVRWEWATAIRRNTPFSSFQAQAESTQMFLRHAQYESALRGAADVDDFVDRCLAFGAPRMYGDKAIEFTSRVG